MRKILITGVGGGVGQSIIKALKRSKYEVVGVDSEVLAAGLHAVPKAYKGFHANDPRYIDRLLEICLKEECGLIFPGHDLELYPLSSHVKRFRSQGIIPVVCSTEVIQVSDDKLETQKFLQRYGFPIIETKPLREVRDFHGPVVLKPQRGGARSSNTYVARSQKELNIFRELVDPDNCVVQEFIEGDEYTCGSITFNKKCFGSIVMRRILRSGDTYKAFVEHPSPLENVVKNVVEALNPFGACNIQLKVRNGIPYIFEINSRCSGTTAARMLAGFNEPETIAEYLFEGTIPTYNIREISILRYWQELVVPNSRIEKLRDTKYLEGDASTL